MNKHHEGWVRPVSGTEAALAQAYEAACTAAGSESAAVEAKMRTLESTLARCEILADQLGAPAGGIADGDRVTF